jgi:hypothetical protein
MKLVRIILATLLLAAPARAAIVLDGSNTWGMADVAEVTGVPVTICGWGNTTSNTQDNTIFALDVSAVQTRAEIRIQLSGAQGGDPGRTTAQQGGSAAEPLTSTSYTINNWFVVCGVHSATNSHTVYLNGGGKVTDTTNVTPANINHTTIGGYRNGSAGSCCNEKFAGRVAEVGLWNVALTDADVTMLTKYAPPCVRRDKLVAYYPLLNSAVALLDFFGASANNLTRNNNPTEGAHPNVMYCQ